MARAIWTGYLSFGLVVLPVGLFSAIEQRDLRFNQFEKGTGKRVRYKRVAEDTDREVPYEKIVKGLETASGDYVMLTPQELAAAEPGKSKTIEIGDFVSLSEIDPIYFEKSYYLAPKDKDAGKPYALLLQAMQDAERVGIAMFVMRGRQYLAAIRPSDNVLVLETLYYADEVRDPKSSLDRLPEQVELSSREIGVAKSLIEQMTVDWEPERYRDAYRDKVLEMAKAKEDGKEITVAPVKKEDTKVVDLTAALERSIAAAKERREGGATASAAADAEDTKPKKASAKSAKSKAADADELAELSREDLYARAQKLKIPGRSKMSREDLADAIADAEAGTRAAS
jgi:DNA end-binding protein Ku